MSEAQLQALLAQIAADAPEWHLFFRFLAWSGMRIGEIVELRWKDVDLGAGIVHVRRGFYNGRIGPPKTRFGKRKLRLTPDLGPGAVASPGRRHRRERARVRLPRHETPETARLSAAVASTSRT